MKILAIDGGLSGAMALIDTDRDYSSVIDMPTFRITKTRKEYDIRKIIKNIMDAGPNVAYIEKAQAMPKELGGTIASFSKGYCFGLLQGILQTLQIPYEIVHPRTWQSEFFRGISGTTKSKAFKVASQLFPKITLVTPRGKVIDGKCDALLLCEYGRRKSRG